MRRVLLVVVVPVLFAACGDDNPAQLVCNQPVEVTYNDQGTFTTDTLKLGGATVTGSGTINVLNLNGLGIVGGAFDSTVDGAEFIRFAIDAGAATNITYFVQAAGNLDADGFAGEATIEAFDVAGASLGTVGVTGAGTMDVSGNFGVRISAFTVTAEVDAFRVGRLNYTACL